MTNSDALEIIRVLHPNAVIVGVAPVSDGYCAYWCSEGENFGSNAVIALTENEALIRLVIAEIPGKELKPCA